MLAKVARAQADAAPPVKPSMRGSITLLQGYKKAPNENTAQPPRNFPGNSPSRAPLWKPVVKYSPNDLQFSSPKNLLALAPMHLRARIAVEPTTAPTTIPAEPVTTSVQMREIS